MLSYCLKCRKNTESKNLRVEKKKKGKIMLSSNCLVCGSKKSRFIKEQKATNKGILQVNSYSRSYFILKV